LSDFLTLHLARRLEQARYYACSQIVNPLAGILSRSGLGKVASSGLLNRLVSNACLENWLLDIERVV